MDKNFISIMTKEGEILVNSKLITHVENSENEVNLYVCSHYSNGSQVRISSTESFEQIKKKLGLIKITKTTVTEKF